MARESDWNGYWQYSLATGILILVMMPLLLIETESAGLLQGILVGLIFLWTEVLAIRILFISQGLPKEQE